MPTLKKFPWVSLALLLVAYTALGWLLSDFHNPLVVWVIIVTGVLLLAAALSSPWSKIRDGLARFFKSDTRAFLFAVASAFLSVVFFTWFHLFAHALVVISAGTLVRLDAQTTGLSERQVFWLLAIVSLIGLGLGGVAQRLYVETLT
jgi:hypothetical protein